VPEESHKIETDSGLESVQEAFPLGLDKVIQLDSNASIRDKPIKGYVDLNSMSVEQLREILRNEGLKDRGCKTELIKRLTRSS
jgi:hypothetical protein